MNEKTLIEILKSEYMPFSQNEIEKIIDDELSKPIEEIDTELVDLCIDALDKKQHSNKSAKRIKKPKFKKLLLSAAILAIIFSLALPVSAEYLNINASENIFNNEEKEIDLREGKTKAAHHSDSSNELVKKIKAEGIENVILPKAILSEDCKTSNFDISGTEKDVLSVTFDIENEKKGLSGYVAISQFSPDFEFALGKFTISETFDNINQFSVNGMDIITASNGEDILIVYADENIQYNIVLENDFKTVKQIVEEQ